MSFRLKTILGIAAIEAVLLLTLIVSSLQFLRASNEEELIKRAATAATLFATTTKDAVLATDLASLDSFVKEALKNPGLVYARVISTTEGTLAQDGDPAALASRFVADQSYENVDDGIFDTFADIVAGGMVYGRVEVGLSTHPIQAIVKRARGRTSAIAVIEMILTALFSFALGLYLTRQIKGLTEGAQKLAHGELGYQVQVHGNDELAQAARAFNDMSRKLQVSYNARKRAEKDLQQLAEELEHRVKLRTQQLAELNKKLEHQALHDGLTTLPNRMLFRDRLQQALLARTRGNGLLAVVIIDLDKFKTINDGLGHHAGDVVLQQLSYRMRAAVAATDTLARLGGDEFALLLPALEDREEALQKAREVLENIRKPLSLGDQSVQVTASLGVAVCPADGDDANALMRHADSAMYAAKRAHSGIAEFDRSLAPPKGDRLALQGELRQAIEQEALLLHYQPKIDFRTGRVSGLQAFVRWPHPNGSVLPPDDFILLAEETGLVERLTLCVLTLAVRQCAAWRERGMELPVGVKISSINLQDPGFPERLSRILAAHRLPASALELGMTELAILVDPLRAVENLARLQAMGVKTGLDDFGTSYSLSYLKDMLIQRIKINRSFVTNMLQNDNDAAIVRYTIDLAHGLGLQVIAEGVENEATWDELKTLGCDGALGYYVGNPMPADELLAWLARSPWAAEGDVLNRRAL
jgi:diguanylate cyclase (GGDEF)-like protein